MPLQLIGSRLCRTDLGHYLTAQSARSRTARNVTIMENVSNISPILVVLGSCFTFLFGLFLWLLGRWHGQAMGELKNVSKAGQKMALAIERHDVEIKNNTKAIDTAFNKLDKLCNSPS